MSKPWEEDFVLDGVTQAAPVEQPRNLKPWDEGYVTERVPVAPPPVQRQEEPEEPSSSFIDKYLTALSGVESSGGRNTVATTSSARGEFQWTEGSWEVALRRFGLDYTMDDRNDPVKAREVTKLNAERNMKRVADVLGRQPTDVELYMTHFLGDSGGIRFLRAGRNTPATEAVSKAAARANRNIFFTRNGKPRTVGEVLSLLDERFERWRK